MAIEIKGRARTSSQSGEIIRVYLQLLKNGRLQYRINETENKVRVE
jgi:hypothetical protein